MTRPLTPTLSPWPGERDHAEAMSSPLPLPLAGEGRGEGQRDAKR